MIAVVIEDLSSPANQFRHERERRDTFMVYVFHGHSLGNLPSFVTCILDPLRLVRRSKVRELTMLIMPMSTCVFLSRQQLSCCAEQSLRSGSLST